MRREDFDYCVFLEARAKQFNVLDYWKSLIFRYPQFKTWAASHNKLLHHYEMNGLARHTAEVVELGLQIIPTLHIEEVTNPVDFYLAALFHDTGKMFDYSYSHQSGMDVWSPTEHRRLIHHISRSVLIFNDIAREHHMDEGQHDAIIHAILAHHGSRDFGSPVAPKSRIAWLLHLCDGLSARMDDCDKMDVIKKS